MILNEIRAAIETALNAGRFFVDAAGSLAWQHQPRQRLRWEIFHGHLLDERHTRTEAVFETWDVLFQPNDQAASLPLISVKLAAEQGRVYVTRELLVYGQEVYEPAPRVIATRPARVPLRELVGTIDLARFTAQDMLADELSHYVLLALVGTSRLPITSVESPLPAFSLGQVGYAPAAESASESARDAASWLSRALVAGATSEAQARALEFALRTTPPSDIAEIGRGWHARLQRMALGADQIPRVVKALFNQVALTPYTSLVDNLVELLPTLVSLGALSDEQLVDLVGYMLRQLVRHLTAFDLVTFHNQGANYPDALLLASLLAAYCQVIERRPDLFEASASAAAERARIDRLRRRALRQAWIIHRQYVGNAVPDVPTSPGENLRVLSDLSHHVPEEQLLRPESRRKRLFDDRQLLFVDAVARVFTQSLEDLEHPRELSELGRAVFLDRPLGLFKQLGEVDRTPLVSYEAFSRQVASERLQQLGHWDVLAASRVEQLASGLDRASPSGFPANRLAKHQTSGVVALEDSLRRATDFQLLRTTRQSLDGMLAGYDLAPLAAADDAVSQWLNKSHDVLLIRTAERDAAQHGTEFLTAFDRDLRPRMRLALARPAEPVYCEARGIELLRHGLEVKQIDEQPANLLLRPKC